jgi:hypothetical protein
MEYHDRPGHDEYAPHFATYVDRVPAGDLVSILREQVDVTCDLLRRAPRDRADFAYAPGKWTVKEVLGHVSDVERVLSYRALWIGRGAGTELPGMDENRFVAAGGFGGRPLGDLIAELRAVRASTVALLRGFVPEAWLRVGVADGHEVSVRALACIMAGHELHHRALLEERYLGAPAAEELS